MKLNNFIYTPCSGHIAVMYGIWKSGEAYSPQLFLGSDEIVALYD
jgi:hypothetical protein